jgi:hypothetical protein
MSNMSVINLSHNAIQCLYSKHRGSSHQCTAFIIGLNTYAFISAGVSSGEHSKLDAMLNRNS